MNSNNDIPEKPEPKETQDHFMLWCDKNEKRLKRFAFLILTIIVLIKLIGTELGMNNASISTATSTNTIVRPNSGLTAFGDSVDKQ